MTWGAKNVPDSLMHITARIYVRLAHARTRLWLGAALALTVAGGCFLLAGQSANADADSVARALNYRSDIDAYRYGPVDDPNSGADFSHGNSLMMRGWLLIAVGAVVVVALLVRRYRRREAEARLFALEVSTAASRQP